MNVLYSFSLSFSAFLQCFSFDLNHTTYLCIWPRDNYSLLYTYSL